MLADLPYTSQSEAEEHWKSLVNNNNNNETKLPARKSVQAEWDVPLCNLKFDQLLSNQSEPVDQARLRAVSSEHASDWLNAVPIPALGLKLDNASIRMACGLRLGSPLCHPHKCQCGSEVDKFGRHGLSCKSAEGRHSRHSQVTT